MHYIPHLKNFYFKAQKTSFILIYLTEIHNNIQFQSTIRIYSKMRMSMSPVTVQTKMMPKMSLIPESMRSSSLTNSGLFSSKTQPQLQNSYHLPYYNQNSAVRIVSQSEVNYQPKSISHAYGNLQNCNSIQDNLKRVIQRVQVIEKQMKKQDFNIKTVQKLTDQNKYVTALQQTIQKQIQQKSLASFEQLYHQIKKLENQIFAKIQLSKPNTLENPSNNQSYQLNNAVNKDTAPQDFQKKILKTVEEKVRDETFKIQIQLQNEINKAMATLKNNAQVNILAMGNKSTLKYKYRPVQINIRSEMSVNRIDYEKNQKRKKQALRTAHSSGSSQQNQRDLTKKVIQIEEQKYFIDKEGYLLDQRGYYLLNEDQKMIRIERSLIKKLREYNMIE